MQFASVGWPARRIADELGVSHTQIQRDLRTDLETGDAA
jgi:predicted DNA-binding transcriptional regulator YafY